jgi:phosphohistidine phosphatase
MAAMELYVIRHAIAEDAAPDQDDAARELTADGEKKLKAEVKGLRELGWVFDRVLTSPWARARRTAELLAPVSECKLEETPLLAMSPTRELLTLLGESGTQVAIVGHEPWLTELIQWLTLADPYRNALVLKKGGIAHLEGTPVPGAMKLRALLPPKILRTVARAS